MSDEDHEECAAEAAVIQHTYPINIMDLLCVGARTVGNVLNSLSAGAHMLGTEFYAHANHRRAEDERIQMATEARMETVDMLERLASGGLMAPQEWEDLS